VLQRMLRDFTDFPKYLKREANRRRDADSGRIVGKPEVMAYSGLLELLPHSPSTGSNRDQFPQAELIRPYPTFGVEGWSGNQHRHDSPATG
jgi:hypothetical protein